MNNKIEEYRDLLENAGDESILKFFTDEYRGRIGLATSFGIEDQVLTDMLYKIDKDILIFTLDTGRLHQETYDVMQATMKKYEIKIKVLFPDSKDVEDIVNEKGPNLFYDSVENRKQCCFVRKIKPLRRMLSQLDVWICGLRKSQSAIRSSLDKIEFDSSNGLIKINPLADWSEEQIWDYIQSNKVPYNKLHDKGFPSIGCVPCTRAIEKGEDIRAGRWWWENPKTKECGLHKVGNKLIRKREI